MKKDRETPAEVYVRVEERGPDPSFAEARRKTAAAAVAEIERRRATKTVDKTLSDWRTLAARPDASTRK
jgi:hypothetical protein